MAVVIWNRTDRVFLENGNVPILFANSTDANAYLARKSFINAGAKATKPQPAAKVYDLITVT